MYNVSSSIPGRGGDSASRAFSGPTWGVWGNTAPIPSGNACCDRMRASKATVVGGSVWTVSIVWRALPEVLSITSEAASRCALMLTWSLFFLLSG